METTDRGLRSAISAYSVNRKHIIIDKVNPSCIADIQEQAIAAGQVLNGRNIAVYAMAALVDDEKDPKRQHLASNATLINDGVIEIHLKEMVESYKDLIKPTPNDEKGIYRFVKCFAMAAGKNSMIVNEGIIRVYFDQGLESEVPVYGETLLAGEGSTIINNGTIELIGDGSFATQARAIAVPANNMTIINNGKIKLDMERTSTIRILATTGTGGSIVNSGDIDIKSSGRIMTVARFADTHILNEGTINILFRPKYVVQKVSFLYQSYPLACAFYEHCLPNEKPLPPIVNNGKVYIRLEGNDESTPKAVAFGIYSEMVGMEKMGHHFENTGSINVSKIGPENYLVAELGCNCQAHKDFPYNIKIGEWHTRNRDFAKTRDLFACGSGIYDFSNTRLTLTGENGGRQIKAEDLIVQSEEQLERKDTIRIENADRLTVEYKK